MATPDKLEAVKKVSEAMSKQSINPAEELERVAPNKEHFQSLVESTKNVKPGSFERIDTKVTGTDELQNEKMAVFTDENVSAQKSGTATDQERKGRQQTEEIEEISAAGSKKKAPQSIMEEAGKIESKGSKMSQVDAESIKKQAKSAIEQIDQVKEKLKLTQGEIKPSYQTLLRNRLSHIDDNLKIALNKAGAEYTPAPKVAQGGGSSNPAQRFIQMLTNSQQQIDHLTMTMGNLEAGGGAISPGNMLAIQFKMNSVQQQIELFTSLLNKVLESTKTIMNVQV